MPRLHLQPRPAGTGCKKSKVDPFPATGAVTGWEKSSDTRTFAAKDLWQYIDGDAEQYISAGVVSTSTSDYKYQGQLEAVVDVYTMGDSAGARKILETGQTKDAKSVQLGDAALAYEQSVTFRKGPYLVRIVAYEIESGRPAGAACAGARGGSETVELCGRKQGRVREHEDCNAALSDEVPICEAQILLAFHSDSGHWLRQQFSVGDEALVSGCHYTGADIQRYNMSGEDDAAMDAFYLLGADGSGYAAIPDGSYDFVILNHVLEHMTEPAPVLAALCAKLKPGGYIWIAFPSLRSLSLPSSEDETLQFCDDPTHVYLPDVREVANILLANGVKVVHAGRSREGFLTTLADVTKLLKRYLRKMMTGKFSGRGIVVSAGI